ncbi:hypothetical protein MHU86_16834 [Fragilaria crotonensis]|nr:hypothetical protein MHU86_16834 [Fragilaria crotonensis]
MTILPMTHPLDHFPSPLRLPMTRLISTLLSTLHHALTAEEKALESYCDDDDTVEFTVVDEATLDDPLNGTIHLRDLPLCIEISTTIAAFCLNFLAAPPEVHHIRDITSPDMKPISRHITLRHQMPSPNSPRYSRDDKFYLLGMIHTLNRATNLLTQHFTDEQRSLLTFGIPDKYYDITRDFYENPPHCPMETQCAVGLIYALRLYYITHHRHSTYHRHGFRQHDLYPKHLFQIAKDIKSTAAALSLFPDTTTFRTLPRFANHAFFEADLFPAFCIPYRGLKRYRKMFRVDLNFSRANPYLVAYTNSFRLDDEEQRSIALRTAQTIIRLALFEHGLINRKTRRRSREPELSNNRFHIGNLPPADLFLSNFATCFPMITRPSLVQLDLDDVNDDTLAINYVVCQPLDFSNFPTNGINFSIDFLPHFEYILYRVAQLVNPKDPTGILPGTILLPRYHVPRLPLASNSYSNGSSTEIAKPTARAGIFPTTFNHDQQPIISNRDGEPYNRLSVQALFKAQLAKPILSYHIGDPDWIPISAANLRRHPDSSKYHVARDPKTVPFSLAIRMIPVFTTGPLEKSIYQAWALPHLIDALRDPEIQLFNNHLSYYYNEKESHPEFPFIDQMGPDSPFSANGYNDGISYKRSLKYAKNANLRKLAYPTDLQARRRHFNTFIDNLRIVCNISPWTRQVFDLWPQQVSYSHPFVGTALYNLIFTNVCDPCQKHIIDGPPDARTAILTLRRHCAPLTPDHVERTREAFCSIKQPHHEVATSYLNRIRILTRDCYHAGIPNTDAELIKRTVRGGSNHSFYAASYQRFDADIRRAELNDEALPPFAELESHPQH